MFCYHMSLIENKTMSKNYEVINNLFEITHEIEAIKIIEVEMNLNSKSDNYNLISNSSIIL